MVIEHQRAQREIDQLQSRQARLHALVEQEGGVRSLRRPYARVAFPHRKPPDDRCTEGRGYANAKSGALSGDSAT